MSDLMVKNKISWPYPLAHKAGRLSVWQKARGLWKSRKQDPIKELKKMRREWERKLS